MSSLVAGVASGLLARLAMSIIAAQGGVSTQATVGQLTLNGTLRIVLIPMVAGIPFALLYLWLGRLWQGWSAPFRAAAYAIAALVVPGLLFLTDSEFAIPGANSSIARWAFLPAFLVYGALVGLIGDRLLARGGAEVRARSDSTSI